VIPIDDPDDPRLELFHRNERGLASRADRRHDHGVGLFMAEGDLVVERAVDAGCRPVAALVDAERIPTVTHRLGDVPVYSGGDRLRAHVTGLGVPQTIVAIFERPPRPSAAEVMAERDRLVLVEAVDNPVNVGGIIRNAAGLGWDGLIHDATSAEPLSRRSLRVSMGHAIAMPAARVVDLASVVAEMVGRGWRVAALTPHGATDLRSLQPVTGDRWAVVIGSERAGLCAATIEACTDRVAIPMAAGVDSLNAAAASAVACYALGRR
jgi:tRNA G18 (ribose-2'-O)-methylase SpoU